MMIQGKQIRQGSSLADRYSRMSGPHTNEVSAEEEDKSKRWLDKMQGAECKDVYGSESKMQKRRKIKSNYCLQALTNCLATFRIQNRRLFNYQL